MSHRPFVAALLLFLAVTPAVATAQAKRPAKETAAQAEARREYERGAQLYRSGQYAEAIAAFEKAYAAQPHPALLFNIGQAQEKRGELEAALEAYRRYLEAAPQAQDRPAVESAISSLEARVAQRNQQDLRIRSTPAEALVTLDGAERGKTPLSARLPLGAHEVVVSLPGHESVRREITLTRDAAVELDLTLPAIRPPEGPKRFWTWVAVGTSAVLAAGGATAGFLASRDRETMLEFQHDQDEVNALYDGAESKALTANVLYGAAGAAFLAGGALFFIEGRF